MIFAAGLAVAVAAVGASATGLSGLSATCQTTLTSVLTGPAATCLDISGLVAIAVTPTNQSIITPLNDWLTTTCAQPACTNATLDSLFSNITNGCGPDLSTAGVTSSMLADIKGEFEDWYPTGREVACLKDSSASDAFCLTNTLQAIQTYIDTPLGVNNISTVLPALTASGKQVPKTLICTTCVQASYALIRPKLNDTDRATWDSYLGGQCGSSFTDGTFPASIIQSAKSSNTSGAMSLKTGVLGSAVAVVLGVAGAVLIAL